MSQQAQSNVHNIPNDTRYEDFFKEVRKMGAESADGKDALPKFGMRLVKAAQEGVISLDVDPVTGQDDSARAYTEYAKAESKKAVHTHTSNGVKSQVSKARAFVKMGVMTTCDPTDVQERGLVIRGKMVEAGEDVKGVYPAMVDISRAQLKSDRDLTDEELTERIRKAQPADKTIEKIISPMIKTLEKLATGEREDGIKDDSEPILNALYSLKERLATLVLSAEKAEAYDKAVALGLIDPNEGDDEVTSGVTLAA